MPKVPQEIIERAVAMIPPSDNATLRACALTCFFMLRASRKPRYRVLHVKTPKKVRDGIIALETKISAISIPYYVEHLIIGNICGQIHSNATDPGIGLFLTAFENLDQITICANVLTTPPQFPIQKPTTLNLSTVEFSESDVVAWAEKFPNLLDLTLHDVVSPHLLQEGSPRLPMSLRHLRVLAMSHWDDPNEVNDGGVCAALCVDVPPPLETAVFLDVDFKDAARYACVICSVKDSLQDLQICIRAGDSDANKLLEKHEVLPTLRRLYFIDHIGRGWSTYSSADMM